MTIQTNECTNAYGMKRTNIVSDFSSRFDSNKIGVLFFFVFQIYEKYKKGRKLLKITIGYKWEIS